MRGVLRFNRVASGSHVNMLLFDSPGAMCAVVGSYNWLSAFKMGGGGGELSIRLRHEGTVAEACGCAAGLWAGVESEALSSTGDRWRSLAAELERQVAGGGREGVDSGGEGGRARVRLIFDREHEAIMREWSGSAQRRLFVFSHRLGPAAETRLLGWAESPGRAFVVAYGLSDLDGESRSRVAGMVRSGGGMIVERRDMHAEILVSDASVCISGYNFLSADPFGTGGACRELGVAIEGGDVATRVAERLIGASGIRLAG